MALLSFTLTGFVLVVSLIYFYLKKRHRFWADRGIPCAPDPHLLYGHVKGSITVEHGSYVNQRLYNSFKKRGLAFGGFSFFAIPGIMVIDPELIKTIMVKDFHVFHDRGIYNDTKADPLSGHLFSLEGQPWRALRQKLSPTFTSGRMKAMFETILEVADEFRTFMVENYDHGQRELEMKDVLARFTSDVIGTCAFGLKCNTLKNPDSDFLKYGKMVFEQSVPSLIKFVFASMFQEQAKKIGVKLTDPGVEKFFMGLTRETVEFREKNNVQRNDFMNLLLQIKNKGRLVDQTDEPEITGKVEPGLTIEELAAQCFVFFIAGFETSSTTMNFCLYELACNQDIQERLRDEIEKAIAANGGKVTYDLVMGLQYLDNVVNETLRKYPPIEGLNRIPITDYTMPGTSHVIPSRTMFGIPVYALHHDPDIYPDPERFDPDRFLPEEVAARHPYTYLPFGEGPRVCIGLRFGVMQTKIGLITLLRSFRFTPTAATPKPLVFDPKSFVLSPIGGNHLRIDKI